MTWSYFFIPKLERLCRWSLGIKWKGNLATHFEIDIITYPAGLKVIHGSKKGPRSQEISKTPDIDL